MTTSPQLILRQSGTGTAILFSPFPFRLFSFLALLAVTSPSYAHDFWIEPSTYHPKVGENLTASLRVGQDFAGDAVPRSVQLIGSFTVRQGSEERPVNGFENEDPAGRLRIDHPGLAVIGYRSKPYPLELPAAKFEEFLRMEGLESISALRAARGESQKGDRERFYRYAKALIVAGEGKVTGFDRPLGYRYEIVPETNPLAANHLVVRALFEGKPLAGALVTAIQQQNPSVRLSARSDRNGRATFDLPGSGVWLVKSVQVVPAPPASNVDWESLWASLTFER
ncbi:MAG TPA: DUF4198 domain-containing protein [Thermoanaerobaculia bacterium]|nr:DUF4198 domain-containing protein [Thermoanaerobaculia bacterium]